MNYSSNLFFRRKMEEPFFGHVEYFLRFHDKIFLIERKSDLLMAVKIHANN